MGKSLNRDERKNSKFIQRDNSRKRKERQCEIPQHNAPRSQRRPKWRPHSEIDVE